MFCYKYSHRSQLRRHGSDRRAIADAPHQDPASRVPGLLPKRVHRAGTIASSLANDVSCLLIDVGDLYAANVGPLGVCNPAANNPGFNVKGSPHIPSDFAIKE